MAKVKQLGHLVLRANNIVSSEKFYTNVLGLHVTTRRPTGTMIFMSARDDASHELALIKSDDIEDSATHSLAHFAWEMESIEDVKEIHQKCISEGIEIKSVADHGVSLGFYIEDPDGNAIEIFYEMPKSSWPKEGDLLGGDFPDSLDGVEAKKLTDAEITSSS